MSPPGLCAIRSFSDRAIEQHEIRSPSKRTARLTGRNTRCVGNSRKSLPIQFRFTAHAILPLLPLHALILSSLKPDIFNSSTASDKMRFTERSPSSSSGAKFRKNFGVWIGVAIQDLDITGCKFNADGCLGGNSETWSGFR